MLPRSLRGSTGITNLEVARILVTHPTTLFWRKKWNDGLLWWEEGIWIFFLSLT